MPRKRIHLVCNAHLDPVWLWEWEEGAGEALSTFRAAAAFCEDYDDFIFNHNEAILYKWVEEYEPGLFKRIRALVRKKKWHILGGWYLQPDCNMPSGESFVRQILLGKSYFKKKFGIDVETGSNLDPFGHTQGLVQILAKSGYDSYIFCRPDQGFLQLPSEEFVWVGFDGSEVLGTRIEAHYNSRSGLARAKVEDWMKRHPDKDLSLLLWGVGNHGGGASKQDIEELQKLILETKNFEIFHSTPETYFRELKRKRASLPRYARSLNPWAPGCYTSMARIKQKHRILENELYSAEKMASAASFQGLIKYPQEELHEALSDLALSEFHDILPGSSISPGEEGALRLLDHGLEICSQVKAMTFFAMASGEIQAKQGEIPIFIYNPHPFKIKSIFECEFQPAELNWNGGFWLPKIYLKGKELPAQPEKELSNLSIEWRKKVVFQAELEPSHLNRFDCRLENIHSRPQLALKASDGAILFRTDDLEVMVNTDTGLIDHYQVKGIDFIARDAFRPIVIKDNADPWGMSVRSFRNLEGQFELMDKERGTLSSGVTTGTIDSVRIIEDGPVRTVIESMLSYRNSVICQRYKLPKQGTEIEVELRVYWNEKDKMLKLAVPTLLSPCQYLGQTAYGINQLSSNGEEAVSQKWVAIISKPKDLALTFINDCVYGSDFAGNELRISLLRSPAHSADPAEGRPMSFQDRYIPRIDQGERTFHFWINGGHLKERLEQIDREALARNEKPFILSYFPPGKGKRAKQAVVLSDKASQITALKKSEKGNDLIIRLFEPTGKKRTTVLSLPFAEAKTKITLKGFEIKTLRFNPKTRKFQETDLLEN